MFSMLCNKCRYGLVFKRFEEISRCLATKQNGTVKHELNRNVLPLLTITLKWSICAGSAEFLVSECVL